MLKKAHAFRLEAAYLYTDFVSEVNIDEEINVIRVGPRALDECFRSSRLSNPYETILLMDF